jgi:hypothetical protein
MKKIFLSPFFTPIAFTLSWATLLTVVLVWFPDQKFTITEDGEILELFTNIGYVSMVAAMLFYSRDYSDKMTSWGIYLFLGISAFLRESGIQHHLSRTDSTPFKSKFFLNPHNPWGEKIVFGLILLLIFGSLAYLAVKYAKHLITSFFKLNTVTWSTAVLCCTLVIAKFTDRFPGNWRKAHDGIALPRNQIEIWSLLEESSEMFLPYLVIIILAQYSLLKQKRS